MAIDCKEGLLVGAIIWNIGSELRAANFTSPLGIRILFLRYSQFPTRSECEKFNFNGKQKRLHRCLGSYNFERVTRTSRAHLV